MAHSWESWIGSVGKVWRCWCGRTDGRCSYRSFCEFDVSDAGESFMGFDFTPSEVADGMCSPSEVVFSPVSLIVASFPGLLLRVCRPCMRGVDWRCWVDVASMEVLGR